MAKIRHGGGSCTYGSVTAISGGSSVLCVFWSKKNNINSYNGLSTEINLQIAGLPGGTKGYPAQPGLIRRSVHLSVRLSVHPSIWACRLGIERKMAQAQQIRSIILQNHEST